MRTVALVVVAALISTQATARSWVSGYYQFASEENEMVNDVMGAVVDFGGGESAFVHRVGGGEIEAAVTYENNARTYEDISFDMVGAAKKHIGNVEYGDISVQMGLSMGQPMKEWIKSSLNGNYMRKSGEIKAADFKRDARVTREFYDALITEIGFPACDGASKDPSFLNLKFAPETVRYKKASGKATGEISKSEQKLWLPSNFRLTIDGLDARNVKKVDALTFKTNSQRDGVRPKEPGKLEYPNLVITIAEPDAASYIDYFDDFVINGKNSDDNEKTGSLTFLDQDKKTELGRVEFAGCGIFKIQGAGEPGLLKVSFYCERYRLRLP